MSSEEEARLTVFGVLTDDRRDAYAMKRERRLRVALDAYRTAIEQRVLAQQPCYAEWAGHPLERCDMILAGSPSKWCAFCTARQTQETSG